MIATPFCTHYPIRRQRAVYRTTQSIKNMVNDTRPRPIAKHGCMFVTLGAIRENNADALYHAIEVDDAVRGTPKHSHQLVVEQCFLNSLILQTLPAAAMQDPSFGQVETDTLRQERLHQVVP